MIEYKVGDKVIHGWHKMSKVQEVKTILNKNYFVLHSYDKSYEYKAYIPDFRHATPEEIQVDRRLEVCGVNK